MLLHNIVLQENVEDAWRWMLDPIHGYSVRGAYRFLTTSGELVDRSQVDDIWLKHIPLKASVFVWRLLHNILPTKDNLVRRSVLSQDDTVCVRIWGLRKNSASVFGM